MKATQKNKIQDLNFKPFVNQNEFEIAHDSIELLKNNNINIVCTSNNISISFSKNHEQKFEHRLLSIKLERITWAPKSYFGISNQGEWYIKLLNQINNWESNLDWPKFDLSQKNKMVEYINLLKSKDVEHENFNIEVGADGELILNRITAKSTISILIDVACKFILLCKAGKGNRDYFVHELGSDFIPDENTIIDKFISIE